MQTKLKYGRSVGRMIVRVDRRTRRHERWRLLRQRSVGGQVYADE